MSSTEHFDELEHRLSELVKEAVQQVKDEFKEKLRSTREQVEEIVGSELNSAREALSSAEADAAKHRANEASEALAAAESRLAEMAGALEAAESRAVESGGSLEAVEARAAEAFTALESAESRAAEANEAQSTAEARINELSESLEAAEGRIAELSEALTVAENAAAEAAAAPSKIDLLGQIMAALGEVDQGRTQAEVLQGLLSGAGDFSSRTAVFLTGPDGLKGWGHRGFGSGEVEFDQIVIDYDEGSAQSRLVGGRGVVELSEEDCFTICNQIDGSRPQRGVLIPLVLANRLAAALYADQFDDNPIDVQALQLLAYLAAQALETLPLREGGSGVTLRLESEVVSEAGLELWDFSPPAAVPEPKIPETLEEMTETEAVDLESVQEERLEVEQAGFSPEIVDYQPAEDSGFAVEVADEPAVDTAAEVIDIEPAVETHYVEEAAAVEEMIATDDYVAEVVEEPVEEEQEATEAAVEEPTEEEAPADMPTEVAPPPPAADGAQVAPPDDLDGPGWAFQTRNLGAEDGEGAAHEEARRLARLLVTEIKLYNEEQVEEGRRNRNIYQFLREDIDRSRQIYEERVDEAVRTGTDYFHDELVRILAAGESDFLGV